MRASIEADLINFTYLKKYFSNNKMEALFRQFLEKILKYTEQIVKNTSHKMSFQIIVSDRKSSFNTRLNPMLQLDSDKKYEVALVNLETFYSFPNMDETNNVFVYSPDNGNSCVK